MAKGGAEEAPAPPAGYVAATGRGGFSTLNGPYFHKPGDRAMAEALTIKV